MKKKIDESGLDELVLYRGTMVACTAPEEVSVPARKHAICVGPPTPTKPQSN